MTEPVTEVKTPTPPPKQRALDRVPMRPGMLRGVISAALVLMFAEFVRSGFYSGYLTRVIDTNYHLPVVLAGAAWSAHLTTDTLMRGPAGALLQRYGPRRVVMGGAALSVVALLLMLVAHSGWMIFLVAILHGIGFSPMWPATMNLTADAAKDGYQGRTLSLVSTSIMPMTGLGLFVFATLAQRAGAVPIVLLAVGVLGISLLLTTLLPAQRHLSVADDPKPRGHLTRALMPLLPAALMQTLTQSLVGNWLFRIAPDLGLADWKLIALLAVGGGIGFGAMPFTGKVADKGRARFAVALGYALVGLAFAGFAFVPPLPVLFALAAVAGLGYAFLTPGWAALITQMLPEAQRPGAWGILMTVESAGFAAGPLLGGFALGHSGVSGLFWVGAVLALLTAAGYTVFRKVFQDRAAGSVTHDTAHDT